MTENEFRAAEDEVLTQQEQEREENNRLKEKTKEKTRYQTKQSMQGINSLTSLYHFNAKNY